MSLGFFLEAPRSGVRLRVLSGVRAVAYRTFATLDEVEDFFRPINDLLQNATFHGDIGRCAAKT